MIYRITKPMEALVMEFHALRAHIETLLDAASGEARDEWRKLVERVPAIADLKAGVITRSEAELEEMKSKAVRLAAILQADRGTRVPLWGPTASRGRPS